MKKVLGEPGVLPRRRTVLQYRSLLTIATGERDAMRVSSSQRIEVERTWLQCQW